MTLILDPDERFSSPEATWETYKRALAGGDAGLVSTCFLPEDRAPGLALLRELGKEEMRGLAARTGSIRKLSVGGDKAQYLLEKKEAGKAHEVELLFVRIDGEWKMRWF
jgi:hypothetical protein